MAEIVIIADDYTGANDTGVMVAECGCRTVTVIDESNLDMEIVEHIGCIAYSTDSRGMEPQEAYDAVYSAAMKYGSQVTKLFSKRIDSTLRGNLGAECDAILDAVQRIQDQGEWMAVICPAFPRAGRVLRDGHLYVGGVPLQQTAVAKDPKRPITTSSAIDLFRKQLRRTAGAISLCTVRQGEKAIAQTLQNQFASGVRAVITDAETDADIAEIARAVRKSGLPIVVLDPGALSQAMAKQMYAGSDQSRTKPGKILFAVGSVNEIASVQTNVLLQEPNVGCVTAKTAEFLQEPARAEAEIRRIVRTGMAMAETNTVVCLVSDGIRERIDFRKVSEETGESPEELSQRINRCFGRASAEMIRSGQFDGVFACGGDIAIALCYALHANGEFPLREVVPLAVYGRLADGDAAGLPIITKGGMVGDKTTMVLCRDFLFDRIQEAKEFKEM